MVGEVRVGEVNKDIFTNYVVRNAASNVYHNVTIHVFTEVKIRDANILFDFNKKTFFSSH